MASRADKKVEWVKMMFKRSFGVTNRANKIEEKNRLGKCITFRGVNFFFHSMPYVRIKFQMFKKWRKKPIQNSTQANNQNNKTKWNERLGCFDGWPFLQQDPDWKGRLTNKTLIYPIAFSISLYANIHFYQMIQFKHLVYAHTRADTLIDKRWHKTPSLLCWLLLLFGFAKLWCCYHFTASETHLRLAHFHQYGSMT